jgi:hypothetical protein
MSSARANASARNRRAGGNEILPQQMNGRPGQPIQQMQPAPKLSISDAIALITLRLGRVEQIVQNMPVDGQNNLAADGENIRIIDNDVFENIVQRLDSLEKDHQNLLNKKPEPSNKTIPSVQVTSPSISKEVTESIEILKAEMVQVKDLLLNLQSFTMQTNQRLSEIVFNGEEFLEMNDDCDGIISGNVTDDAPDNKNITIESEDVASLEELETISSP